MNKQEKIEEFKKKYGKGWLTKWNSYRHAIENKDKSYRNYRDKPKRLWTDWDYYRDEVNNLTEKAKHQIPNIHKRGYREYHIDHKISIREGYDRGILPEHIAHISNLHMMYWKDNVRKKDSSMVDSSNEWILNTDI